MKIKYKKPNKHGIYEKAVKQFGVNFDDGVIFTIGDTIYTRRELTPDFIIHEATHIKQQAEYGVKEWWKKYFEDDNFRFNQELEAYRNQYQYINKHWNSSNKIFKALRFFASCLSGKMYGGMCDFGEAIKLIIRE